jgi:hypothetical protein
MNTIYLLSLLSADDYVCGFAGNDEEIQWLAIKYYHEYNSKYNLNVDGLEVRAEIDWEARTVTVMSTQESISVGTTYHIYTVIRATQEDAQ